VICAFGSKFKINLFKETFLNLSQVPIQIFVFLYGDIHRYVDSFRFENKPGLESDHSSPSSAEVKSAWSQTSTSLVGLHFVVLN
jgi:hypothetical protein